MSVMERKVHETVWEDTLLVHAQAIAQQTQHLYGTTRMCPSRVSMRADWLCCLPANNIGVTVPLFVVSAGPPGPPGPGELQWDVFVK